jgi:pimeloyl-ACP methyl ester carboxylesterase
MTADYLPLRAAQSRYTTVRGLRYHFHEWGDASMASPERPTLVMVHGWMDVGASFQFVVDALAQAEGFQRHVLAPDWRGFGLTETPGGDCYWLPDYIGDLDGLMQAWAPPGPVDLLGHSMGGNVVMTYAGARPERIRRLVNLEGFGLPATEPSQAPQRLVQWLDELRTPQHLRSYDTAAEVAERLMLNNPRLSADKAGWLAPHWAQPQADGRWHILGDPAHKRLNPILYQRPEALEYFQRIAAPVLWVEGTLTDVSKWWGNRYPRADFESRLAVVRQLKQVKLEGCGHMLHHDRPEALGEHLAAFLA